MTHCLGLPITKIKSAHMSKGKITNYPFQRMTALNRARWIKALLRFEFFESDLKEHEMNDLDPFGNFENAEEDLDFYDQDSRGGIQIFPGSELDHVF